MLPTDVRLAISDLASRFRRSDLLLPAFLLLHAWGLAWFAGGAKPWSFACLIAAPLLAAAACLHRARRSGCAEGWVECAIAMVLWSGGMSVAMYNDLFVAAASDEPGLGMLLYVLYGVPLIFAVASPEGEAWHMRLVDGALALALGWLFFVHTFTFATLEGTSDEGFLNLRLMFDIENAFIALFALVRFLASREGSRRAFFAMLSLFAFAYLATAAYINHFQSEADFGTPADLVIGLPFLLLAAAALHRRPAHALSAGRSPSWRPPSVEFARLVRAGSPLVLPATLLVVSGLLAFYEPGLAVTGFAIALLGYGLRSVLAQVRGDEERDRLSELTLTDQLTGLPNRRHFDETLQREWNRARRTGAGLSVLMIDIDHFKQLNDGLGHQTGDLRLQEVGRTLGRCATRAEDLVARYGGEEFVVVLPSTNAAAAARLAEKMRDTVAKLRLASPAPAGFVTVSIGLGWIEHVDRDAPDELVATADAALYEAKRAGRNCVRRGQADAPPMLLAAG